MSGDECRGAECVGHAILPWELVEAAYHVGHEMSNEQFRHSGERESVDA